MLSIDTTETKYYEYNLYYDDVLIKTIVLVESKIMHLPLCLLISLKHCSKNETGEFKLLICEINHKCYKFI